MFRRNTVFVVGAGASKELGLPVGSELADRISAMCDVDTDPFGRAKTPAGRDILDSMRWRAGGDQAQIDRWLTAMKDIKRALPFRDSIDAVIDQYYDRPEVAEIGKYMIAKMILDAEAQSSLKAASNRLGLPDLANSHATWLHTFSRMLFEQVRKDRLEHIGNNISIICFNYDRCIERYLSQAISETYGLNIAEASEAASHVKIIHVYGSLGILPNWPQTDQGAMEVPFGDDNQDAWEVAGNLQTFSESVASDRDEAIKTLIREGEQYVYLGFSFGRQNMELLRAGSEPENERDSFASGYGQYEQGRAAICQLIQRTYSTVARTPRGLGPFPGTKLELDATARALLELHWHNILG